MRPRLASSAHSPPSRWVSSCLQSVRSYLCLWRSARVCYARCCIWVLFSSARVHARRHREPSGDAVIGCWWWGWESEAIYKFADYWNVKKEQRADRDEWKSHGRSTHSLSPYVLLSIAQRWRYLISRKEEKTSFFLFSLYHHHQLVVCAVCSFSNLTTHHTTAAAWVLGKIVTVNSLCIHVSLLCLLLLLFPMISARSYSRRPITHHFAVTLISNAKRAAFNFIYTHLLFLFSLLVCFFFCFSLLFSLLHNTQRWLSDSDWLFSRLFFSLLASRLLFDIVERPFVLYETLCNPLLLSGRERRHNINFYAHQPAAARRG